MKVVQIENRVYKLSNKEAEAIIKASNKYKDGYADAGVFEYNDMLRKIQENNRPLLHIEQQFLFI